VDIRLGYGTLDPEAALILMIDVASTSTTEGVWTR
jgi:hypothetical protein